VGRGEKKKEEETKVRDEDVEASNGCCIGGEKGKGKEIGGGRNEREGERRKRETFWRFNVLHEIENFE
jgi:hypothetical protein